MKPAAGRTAVSQDGERIVLSAAGVGRKSTAEAVTWSLYGTLTLVCDTLRPNFWRASTDNDWRGWRVGQIAGCWKRCRKDPDGRPRPHRRSRRDGACRGSDSVRLTLVYTLDGTGALAVAYDLQIAGQLPLRAGLRTRFPNTLGRMAY